MTALSLLVCAALAAPRPPAPEPAEPPPPATAAEQAERIQAALGRIHGSPAPATWRSLGPGADEALLKVAADGAALPRRRALALTGLSHLGGARAEAALTSFAAQEGLPFAVRAAALEGAGRLLAPAALHRALSPVLAARRPADRTVAAEVLAERAPAESCGAIRARAALRGERPGLARALSRCGASGR
ncbi:MAG: hypothetical protein HZB56_07040 [Deltaproteobacteria bacterium]|nr:hypothetical protein [Deltaproteobacteria bacterium]